MPPPTTTPILLIGSGTAGLCTALWLSTMHIPFILLEKRPGPMERGQADGVQCRTVEVFESFGLSDHLVRDAFWVREVVFWGADGEEGGKLRRTGRTADTEKGLSHMPHVILNQARLNGIMLDAMEGMGVQGLEYGWEVKGVSIDAEGEEGEFPVRVVAEKVGSEGETREWRAKYVLGCDGAHSTTRHALSHAMLGDTTDAIWAVTDIYPLTTFPDIRKKTTIHSPHGNLLIIPREGGSLVRFYIELPAGTSARDVTLADIHRAAKNIFMQYELEFAETYWWSAYAIGQRVVDAFSARGRVFLTGDACHTHSPKAGQGMNVSLQDGYNIGWKLGHVMQGRSKAEVLLPTYDTERKKVAEELIEMDRGIVKLFSLKKAAKKDGDGDQERNIAKLFEEGFKRNGRFTAGLTGQYNDSVITWGSRSTQHLAPGLPVGMRFLSAQVVRFCDVREIELVRALKADGRWRIVIFAGDINKARNANRLRNIASFLSSSSGPVHTYTPPSADIDSFIEPIVVLHGDRTLIEQEQIPDYFWPKTGQWGIRDLHKTYIDDEHYNAGHGHAYEKYGIDPEEGAVVTVRPDQHVSLITPLDEYSTLMEFFAGFCLKPSQSY